jgi:coenzyme F420-reducing hydrogenase alpha subunit
MATARRDPVERGLALKKAGNAIMEAVGERAIQPINVRPGGFCRAPARAGLTVLTESLKPDDAELTAGARRPSATMTPAYPVRLISWTSP